MLEPQMNADERRCNVADRISYLRLSAFICGSMLSFWTLSSAAEALGEGKVVRGPDANAGKPVAGIRNVIIMIGDGMGPQEVGLLTQYAKLAANSTVPDRTTAIEHVLNEGVVSIV